MRLRSSFPLWGSMMMMMMQTILPLEAAWSWWLFLIPFKDWVYPSLHRGAVFFAARSLYFVWPRAELGSEEISSQFSLLYTEFQERLIRSVICSRESLFAVTILNHILNVHHPHQYTYQWFPRYISGPGSPPVQVWCLSAVLRPLLF